MSESQILIEQRGHVCVITLNDPKTRNAFSKEMMVRAADAFKACDENPDVRVIVLTGAGGNFSSGANLKEQVVRHDTEWQRRLDEDQGLWMRAFLRTDRPSKPVIAAIEGFALAGGTEVMLGADIRVAAQGAVFGLSEVKRGLVPLGGATARLAKQIPYSIALEMLITGRTMDAAEAASWGLVGHVVEDGRALEKALEIADIIAENGPMAVKTILRAVRENVDLPEEEAMANELTLGWPRIQSAEANEGRAAFMEKRKPNFSGLE